MLFFIVSWRLETPNPITRPSLGSPACPLTRLSVFTWPSPLPTCLHSLMTCTHSYNTGWPSHVVCAVRHTPNVLRMCSFSSRLRSRSLRLFCVIFSSANLTASTHISVSVFLFFQFSAFFTSVIDSESGIPLRFPSRLSCDNGLPCPDFPSPFSFLLFFSLTLRVPFFFTFLSFLFFFFCYAYCHHTHCRTSLLPLS